MEPRAIKTSFCLEITMGSFVWGWACGLCWSVVSDVNIPDYTPNQNNDRMTFITIYNNTDD